MLYMSDPKRGPQTSPRPAAASIQPMYISLSLLSKDPIIAMLDVLIAPAPIPPIVCAKKLVTRKMDS